MRYLFATMFLLLVLSGAVTAQACIKTEGIETYCDDEIDNDCDGNIDANDSDCDLFLSDYDVRGASISIVQGERKDVDVIIKNTGQIPIELTIEAVMSQGIETFFTSKNISLELKDQRVIDVGIHVPLHMKPGEYRITLKFGGPPNKDAVIIIRVSENELIGTELVGLENSVANVKEKMEELEESGVNVSSLRNKIEILVENINQAKESITKDDPESLRTHIDEAERILVKEVSNDMAWLQALGLLYTGVPMVVGGSVLALIFALLISKVIIPFFKLRKKIEELERRQGEILDARKSAEMQYFRREIDESTFRNILSTEQHSLLTLRNQIKETRGKAHGIIGAVFDMSGIREFFKGISKTIKPREKDKFKHTVPTPIPIKTKNEPWQKNMQKKFKLLEEKMKHRRGEKRKEAEELLYMSNNYLERGMKAMTIYYFEKAKKALK